MSDTRLVLVQAHDSQIVHSQVVMSAHVLDDSAFDALGAYRQQIEMDLLKHCGHVDIERFEMLFEYPLGHPYDPAYEGRPVHKIKDGAYILNGPEAGTWSPPFPYRAHSLRTINGNHVEAYGLFRLYSMTFAVWQNTEAPQWMAPGLRELLT
jgi:hypothetical protein